MLIEYIGKKLLSLRGIQVPQGEMARTPEKAVDIARQLGGEVVLKVQIPSGGRGKSEGVKFANSNDLDQVYSIASELMKRKFSGYSPLGLLVEKKAKTLNEYYLSFTVDDVKGVPVFMFSSSGGTDVEKSWDGDKNTVLQMDPIEGAWEFQLRDAISSAKVDRSNGKVLAQAARRAYEVFNLYECRLVEINPLAIVEGGAAVALDAKVDIDEDGIGRLDSSVKEIIDTRDGGDELEEAAKRKGLNFVMLDPRGNVGVITGGAGLGMATVDIMYSEGLKPANFLDLGGGATAEKVMDALRLVLRNTDARAVFVNVYGGINNLADIAKGIVSVKQEAEDRLITVKMQGHFQEEAKRILEGAGVKIFITPNTRMAVSCLAEMLPKGGRV
jgi:succinyl-CoA synthetase beta subunit